MKKSLPKNTKSVNIILHIICGALVIIGLWQVFTNRLEDGLINMIIGLGLSAIPFSDGEFNYKSAPIWQKALVILVSVFVVVASIVVLYMAFSG